MKSEIAYLILKLIHEILKEHLYRIAGKIIMHSHFLVHRFNIVFFFFLVGLKRIYKLSLFLTTSPIIDYGYHHYPGTGGVLDWNSHFTACVHLGDKEAVFTLWKEKTSL